MAHLSKLDDDVKFFSFLFPLNLYLELYPNMYI